MRPTEEDALRSQGDYIRSLSEKRPEELESDIVRIRSKMDRTLSDIERKLDTGEILRRTQAYLTAGPGEFGLNLGKIVKENPVPVLLVGIGLAWLGLSGLRESGRKAVAEIEGGMGRSSWKDLSHAISHFRGNVRRRRKEIEAGTTTRDRRRSPRRHEDRRREAKAVGKPMVMSSLGAAVGAALSAAFPRKR